MPSHEFWEGDPWLVRAYREAQELRSERRNQELWLQGLYVHDAVSVAITNAFGKKKGQKPERYTEKPIRITPPSEKEKAVRAERARKKLIADLTAWEKRFNKTAEGGERDGSHD